MASNRERLEEHILDLSEADDFNSARVEWSLVHIEFHHEWDQCPCGKDIKELCHIRNDKNGETTYVGNVCVKNFMGISTGNLFAGLRRIIDDPEANTNEDLIRYAKRMGYLYSDKEYNFLMQTKNKRKLSPAQLAWKKKINRRIVEKIEVRKPT